MSGFASLCVLSYNRPQFLAQMLRELRATAGHPFELIVHDDGSNDPSLQAMLSQLQRAGLISTLILNPPGHNQGVGFAVERMFGLALGDPLIKMDQDLCAFRPNWLKDTVDILHNNQYEEPQIGTLGAFHYDADPVDHQKMYKASYGEWEHHEDYVGSYFAVPRDIYEEFGPFETHSDAFAEDVAFKTKLRSHGFVSALPRVDFCVNRGFGPGPSTVVESFENGEGTVHKIHHGPLVFE